MEAVHINEDVRVGAAFDNSKVVPVWFRWHNRYYKVKAVNFIWSSNQGAAKLRHYAVTDENGSVYELCFNPLSLEWTLRRAYIG